MRMKKNKRFTITQQFEFLRHTFPESKGFLDRGNALSWTCTLQPTAISPKYRIRILCKDNGKGYVPKIFVISPQPLKLAEGHKRLPHVYNHEKQQLCLYDWRCDEWKPSFSIASTIVPWAAEWLYFYEAWVITGEWLGGGRHPQKKEISEEKKEEDIK